LSKKLSLEEVYTKLSESSGKSVEELQADFANIVTEVKKDERFTTAQPEIIEGIARNKLLNQVRREQMSPAITWEGTVIGIGDLVDTVRRQRMLSVASFKNDPVGTEEGKTYQGRPVKAKMGKNEETGKEELKVLYPKTPNNDKWGRTGKELPEHSWLRNVYGVASPIDKKTRKPGEPKIFNMTISNKLAQTPTIPIFEKVRFKGIDKTKPEDAKAGEYAISDSAFTKFNIAPELNLPDTETILSQFCANRYQTLGDLEEYHAQKAEDWSRWVVTEGNVSLLNVEPNSTTQNMRMVMDDESLLFAPVEPGRSLGITCWIPTDRGIVIDFAQDSRIYIVGRTTQGKKQDPITKEKTEEPGDVMINVYGIYCPDMFKVIEADDVPEEALTADTPDEEPAGGW